MTSPSEPRPSPLVSAAPWLVLLAFLAVGVRVISNTDFWMHTAVGRAVLESGPFAADTLTHIGAGHAFVKAGWLYGVVMYLLQGLGGGVVTLVHLGAAAFAFALLARTARRQSDPLAVAFSLLLCLWLIAPRLDARPAVFSLVFPAAMIALLTSQPRGLPVLVKMAVLQVLWVNTHTTFLAGPLIALAFAAEAAGGGSRHSTLTRTDVPGLVLMAGVMVAASLLNPSFHRIFAHVFSADVWTTLPEPAASITAGWTQPFITPFANDFSYKGSALLINVVMLLAAGGLVFYRDALPYARTALAVAAAVLVMGHYTSTVELFTVMAFPLLALSMGCLGAFLRGLLKGNPGQERLLPAAGTALLALLALGTVFTFVTNSYYLRRGMPTRFGLGVNREVFPADAMDIINRPDFPANFINLPADGGYLATKLAPGRKTFIDARQKLHAGAYADLVDALVGADKDRAEAASKRMFADWPPGAAVINTPLPYAQDVLARLLASGMFKPAYLDGTTAILMVPSRENVPLLTDASVQQLGLARLEEAKNRYRKALGGLPAPLPARLMGGASTLIALNHPKEAQVLLAALRAGNPNLYSGRLNLAMVDRALNENEKALAVLDEATAMEPNDPKPHLLRAEVLKALGRDKDAEDAAAEARRLAPPAAAAKT